MSAPTPATQPVKTKSKAYSSTVAIQGDAAKYRLKYKELKKKVREIEVENDKLHLKTLGIKRNIQRMRLERAILYERLEAESQATPSVAAYPPPPQHYEDARRDDPYAAQATNGGVVASSSTAATGAGGEYPGYGSAASASNAPPAQSARTSAPTRASYGSAYDDYPPPAPLRSQPHTQARAYAPSYDSRHSPPPLPPSSTGDRAERLRQYTESASPEPARRAASPAGEAALPASSSSRSAMKVTLRRGV